MTSRRKNKKENQIIHLEIGELEAAINDSEGESRCASDLPHSNNQPKKHKKGEAKEQKESEMADIRRRGC